MAYIEWRPGEFTADPLSQRFTQPDSNDDPRESGLTIHQGVGLNLHKMSLSFWNSMNQTQGPSKPKGPSEDAKREAAKREQAARQAEKEARLTASLDKAKRDMQAAKQRRVEAQETVTIKVGGPLRFAYLCQAKRLTRVAFHRKRLGTTKSL